MDNNEKKESSARVARVTLRKGFGCMVIFFISMALIYMLFYQMFCRRDSFLTQNDLKNGTDVYSFVMNTLILSEATTDDVLHFADYYSIDCSGIQQTENPLYDNILFCHVPIDRCFDLDADETETAKCDNFLTGCNGIIKCLLSPLFPRELGLAFYFKNGVFQSFSASILQETL